MRSEFVYSFTSYDLPINTDAASQTAYAVPFEVFYQAMLDRVYAYARARTKHVQEAEDLTQHIFLQALKAWHTCPETAEARTLWLFRIARNAAIDVWRKRRDVSPLGDMLDMIPSPTAEDGEQVALRNETVTWVRVLVASKSSADRDLVALRFAACLGYAEIATIVGKSETAVRKQMSRLLHSLRRELHENIE